jgi:RNA polymerase sigma-70 factor (ECF subfamily)
MDPAVAGDEPNPREWTFDAVYAAYERRIYRYCYRLCGNAADAEDIAQDAFIQVYRALDRFEGRSTLLTWIYRIARNEWIRRCGGTQPTVGIYEETQMTSFDPQHTIIERLWLQSAVARLSEPLREALILVKCEGLTYRDAAEVLGLPAGTVQFRVHEALRKLRRDLAAQGLLPAFAPLWWVGRQVRRWGPVTTPPSLRDRVGRATGTGLATLPPAGTAGSGSVGPTARRVLPPWATGSRAHRVAAVLALAVLLLVLLALWPRPPRSPAERALDRVLATMAQVRSAHATGVQTNYIDNANGRTTAERLPLEFWFEAPDHYRRSVRGTGTGNSATTIVLTDGTRNVLITSAASVGQSVLPVDHATVLGDVAPFAFFSRDGALVRAVGAPGTQVQGAAPGAAAEPLQLDVATEDPYVRRQWRLHVGADGRVARADFRLQRWVEGTWRPFQEFRLDRIDYGIAAPAALFNVPPAGSEVDPGILRAEPR